jgi:uracil-DNA glycosylase
VARALRAAGYDVPKPLVRFAHGARYRCGGLEVLASFHPSRLNTQTGRLTPQMFDSVLALATKSLAR